MKTRVKAILLTVLAFVMMLSMNVFASEATLDVPHILTGSEQVANASYSFTEVDRFYDSDGATSYCGKVVPIKVTVPGVLRLTMTGTKIQSGVYMELYYDEQCTNYLSFLPSLDMTGQTEVDTVTIPKAGIYYLRLESYHETDATVSLRNEVNIKAESYSATDKTLKANTWMYTAARGNTNYYAIKVDKTGYVTIYSNQEFNYKLCNSKKKALYDYSSSFEQSEGYRHTYRLTKGTYYIQSSAYTDDEFIKLKYTFTTSDTTLTNKKYATVIPANDEQNIYLKVKPSKSGYITLTLSSEEGCEDTTYVTLCNSKKKALTEKEWIYSKSTSALSNRAVFSVKKGETYYIKTNGSYGKFKIKYTLSSVSEKSGTSKKKAVTVAKSKTFKGTILPGSETADWYKFKLTKSQYVTFNISGNATGSLKMKVYNSKGKEMTENTIVYNIGDKNTLKTWSKWAKGTYYIKIYRANSKSSGNYSMNWK